MKKQFYTIGCFLFMVIALKAQITTSSQWTWVKGDNTINQPGVYGTKGVADAANKPGARGSCITWTDASGNFWLFGGEGYATGGNNNLFNDLWKYNTSTNEWTWISGANTSNQRGIYGTKGVADVANIPGARYEPVTWTDASGNFWIFGGYGNDESYGQHIFNDLWKYNPAIDLWTWVSGDSSHLDIYAVYGTKGTANNSNKPGARYAGAVWIDGAGNFWLFGGQGFANYPIGGSLNDLWKYNPITNQWTWISGTNINDQSGIYGIQGMAASSNTPGARHRSTVWSDVTGNLWLFGGVYYYANNSSGFFNDLWKYNIATNQWTWMNGSNAINQPGVYGSLGTPATVNTPGARESSIPWKDAAGDFWLFGGEVNPNSQYFNDLWRYNITTNSWTWMNGSNFVNQTDVYGTMGVAAASNRPGARIPGGSWIDATGNFWLFGGVPRIGLNNDLWKLSNVTVLPVTITSVKAYQQNANIAVEWQVQDESGIKQYDVEKSTDGISFNYVGEHVAKGNNNSTLNYSWLDVNALQGNNFYRIKSVGFDGETKYSQIVKVTTGNSKSGYAVIPNPVINNGNLQLQFINQAKGNYQVRIMNAYGQVMQVNAIAHEAGSSTEMIKTKSYFSKGEYLLEIIAPNNSRQIIKIVF